MTVVPHEWEESLVRCHGPAAGSTPCTEPPFAWGQGFGGPPSLQRSGQVRRRKGDRQRRRRRRAGIASSAAMTGKWSEASGASTTRPLTDLTFLTKIQSIG